MRSVSRANRAVFLRAGVMRCRRHAVPPRVQHETAREAAREIIRKPLEFSRSSRDETWWRECQLAVNYAMCEVVCDTPRAFSVLTASGERAAIQPFIYL